MCVKAADILDGGDMVMAGNENFGKNIG